MKKMITLLAVAALTLSLAGNALAAFGNESLTRFVYGTANEVATDLGNVNTLVASAPQTVGGGADAWNATYGGLTVGTSGLYVGYMARDAATGNLWISAQSGLGVFDLTGFAGYGSADANLATTQSNYASKGPNASYLQGRLVAGQDTYFATLDLSQPGLGTFAGLIDNIAVQGGSMSLAGSAVQGLYFLDAASPNSDLRFHEVATILTNTDGSTTINALPGANPVPIPAAAYLLGSGLLGLVGIRRRMEK